MTESLSFASTKRGLRIEGFLRSRGCRVAGIHCDLSQAQRTLALGQFKSGKCPLLIATDVAARGLDIPAVKLVINCTFPLTIEDYVHRIGRTGRAGAEGMAYTFFTEHDKVDLTTAIFNIIKS
jgi:ATP-dependent RNA helicase DBP3